MPIHPKPGDESLAQDMSPESAPAVEAHGTPLIDPAPAEEEGASKLDDFA